MAGCGLITGLPKGCDFENKNKGFCVQNKRNKR